MKSWEWLFSHDRQTRDTANTIQGRQEPEVGTLWVIEVVVPLRQNSDIVQHRSARQSYLVGKAYMLWKRVNVPVITSRRRSDTNDSGIKVQFPQAWVFAPIHIG
jgi:hypothetical protein